MKKLLIFIFFLLLASPGSAAVIYCTGAYEMTADNSTDNTTIFNAATAAAALEVEKTVSVPTASGSYFKLASTITIPDGVTIIGDDGAAINPDQTMILGNSCVLDNISFDNTGGYRTIAIGESGIKITGVKIKNCSFGGSDFATVIGYLIHDCVFDNNTITNTGTGQNINILGGQNNVITNNTFTGGKTGLLFKYYYSANGGGFDSCFIGNIIVGNTISGHSEEGISFDSNSALTTTSPNREYDTVASIDGADITLTSGNWGGGDDPDYVGLFLVPVTGSAIGQYRKITVQADAVFTVDSAFTDLAPADGVSIQAVFYNNIIAYNNVNNGYSGDRILLFGNCFNNRIENNDVNSGGGIAIKSLDRLFTGPVAGNAGRGPCSYNLIKDNTAANIWIRYRCVNYSGSYGPYNSYGNVVKDNTITGILTVNYQLGYWNDGNTGGFSLSETNGNDCSGSISPYAVDLGSTALDVTAQTCEDYNGGCVTDTGSVVAHATDFDDSCAGALICSLASATVFSGGTVQTGVGGGSISEEELNQDGATVYTVTLTISEDTWVATIGADNAITDALIAGITCTSGAQADGFAAHLAPKINYEYITRDSDTQLTWTIEGDADYDISTNETWHIVVPASALASGVETTSSPDITISATQSAGSTGGRSISHSAACRIISYGSNGITIGVQ